MTFVVEIRRSLSFRLCLYAVALVFYTYIVVAVVKCQNIPPSLCRSLVVYDDDGYKCGSCVLSQLAKDLSGIVQLLGLSQQLIVSLFTEVGLTYVSYLIAATAVSNYCYAGYRKIRPRKTEVPCSTAEGSALEMVLNHKQPFGDANPKYAGVLLAHKGWFASKEFLEPSGWLSSPNYRAIGTAWRLSNDVLVTAKHVIDGLDPKESLSIGTMDKNGRARPLDIPKSARVHFVPAMDVAFIKHPDIANYASRLGLTKLSPVKTFASAVHAVGYHPEMRKIVTSHMGHVNLRDGTHTCNTVRGMSGGPLISSGRFVGMHTGGSYDSEVKLNHFLSGKLLLSLARRIGVVGEESPYEDDQTVDDYYIRSVDEGDTGNWGDDVTWEYVPNEKVRSGSRFARTLPDEEECCPRCSAHRTHVEESSNSPVDVDAAISGKPEKKNKTPMRVEKLPAIKETDTSAYAQAAREHAEQVTRAWVEQNGSPLNCGQPADFHLGVSSNNPFSGSPSSGERTQTLGFQEGFLSGYHAAAGLRNNVASSESRRLRQKEKRSRSKATTKSGKQPGKATVLKSVKSVSNSTQTM
jgi:hypothetical protein